ncbi:VOC family protein [Virgibacillus salarius]|uniref:VOC family protein n=1 Tax=Virgibacillus salarius TaxID=447199 RepID=UPI00248F91CE|nr:VOC family protein [Virgibacillus salarius]WBX80475.1 VOC family protein [Virgibacillus salarius]
MIKKAIQLTLFVHDLKEAKDFYVNKLGFVVREEEEFEPGWRYLAVSPENGNETMIELAEAKTPKQEQLIGKQGGDTVMLMFESDHIERDVSDLQERGVVFQGEIQGVLGGKGVVFKDLYGNNLDLFEPRKE